MQRLSLLFLGLVIAWLGARLIAGAESFAPYLLRDALLLGTLGGLVFAFNAQGWQAPPVFRRLRGLPRPGQILLLTGLIVTLGSSVGLASGLAGVLGLAATIAWWLGILLQFIGSWWPGAAVDYARPQVRWSRDASGNFVPLSTALEEGSPAARSSLSLAMGRRTWLAWLLLILAAAAFLRFWNLEQLPPGCINQECNAALQLTQGPPGGGTSWRWDLLEVGPPGGVDLQGWLAVLFVRITQAGVLSLRLAATTIGWLTVLVMAAALQRLVGPAAALLGAALLAISPWHIWAGRSSDPWIAAAFLAAITLWLALEAMARTHARWWVLWGISAGLLTAQTLSLWPGIAVWVAATASLGLVQGWRRRGHVGENDLWQWPLAGLFAALGVGLPAVAATLRAGGAAGVAGVAVPDAGTAGTAAATAGAFGLALPGFEQLLANMANLANALLRPEVSAIGPFVETGLVNSLVVALALVGCGALLRHLRQPQAGMVLAGAAGLLAATALLDLSMTLPGSVLLVVLPLLLALSAAALDRLLAVLVHAWGPPLVPAARLVAVAALALLLVAGRGTVALMLGLDAVSSGSGTAVEIDMARYIGEWFRQSPADSPAAATTFVAPSSVINHPSVQLLAGSALANGHVQPLELGRTLPYGGLPNGDVVYLLPLLDTQVFDLLRQLYPMGEATTEVDAAGERSLFNRFTVRQADLSAAQTIQMTVTPADATAATAYDQPLAVAAMNFAWSAAPPRALPFTAEWNGSLVLPESGNYRIAVDSPGPESTFTLLLDDILLLDSSLGMRDQQQALPQGIHRLKMTYRSGNQPGDLRVYWTTPDGAEQILAAPSLHWPTLADQGLYGDYFDNDHFEGTPVATHKDPIIGLDPGLPLPYSVRWHGLLAAPRAGEYLLGADAGGFVQLVVDGQTLADNRAGDGSPDAAQEMSSYIEGLIYLSAGWHPIEVRFAPDAAGGARNEGATGEAGQSGDNALGGKAGGEGVGAIAPGGIRLLWQPPGSDVGALSSHYLLPAYGQVEPTDVALPPAPPLADPMLGDDTFALARASEVWQAHLRIPPSNLPPLPLERLWQAGGVCGSAPDQFDGPHGVAFSPSGDKIYVADTANRRVVVYSVDGAQEKMIVSDLLQEPVDVAVAPDGTLLILDAEAQGVFRLEAGGELVAVPLQTGFYRPRGLTVDAMGNMAIADTGGARIAIVEPNGAPAGQFGGQGSLLGRGQPVDALAAEGALWAISAEDGRLWNLTADGSMTAVQPTGTVDGPQLGQLVDGRLLVTDPVRGTFLLLASSGQPLGQFAYSGELVEPTGIAATRIGDGDIIAVVDTRACALSVWRLAQ